MGLIPTIDIARLEELGKELSRNFIFAQLISSVYAKMLQGQSCVSYEQTAKEAIKATNAMLDALAKYGDK